MDSTAVALNGLSIEVLSSKVTFALVSRYRDSALKTRIDRRFLRAEDHDESSTPRIVSLTMRKEIQMLKFVIFVMVVGKRVTEEL